VDRNKALFQDLLIGVTQFFRDPEAFDALTRVSSARQA
jgi:chemotaxis methyl-accepting protein methylase